MLALSIMLAKPTNSNAQAIEEGKILIDGYYGFGSLYTAFFKAMATGAEAGTVTYSGFGPAGLRAEYLISDKVGFGVDLAFSSASLTYSESYTTYDANYNVVSTSYDTKLATSKIGAIVTFNYHFIESDKFDAYFATGLGYGNRTTTYTSKYADFTSPVINSLFPVAAKIGLGMRYFFTDNIGANLAIGLGHSGLVNFGVSAKF